MKVNGIKIYKASPEVLKYYREEVKGNSHLDDQQIALKLTRNILLAYRVSRNSLTGKTTYVYGNLKITCRYNKVVEISNSPENKIPTWWLNKKQYIALSELLGITDCKYSRKHEKSKIS